MTTRGRRRADAAAEMNAEGGQEMADIDVVKKGSSSWLWIVIALVVLAIILWFVMRGDPVPQAGFLLDNGLQAVPTEAWIA